MRTMCLYLSTVLNAVLSEMGVGILFITGPGALPALCRCSGNICQTESKHQECLHRAKCPDLAWHLKPLLGRV